MAGEINKLNRRLSKTYLIFIRFTQNPKRKATVTILNKNNINGKTLYVKTDKTSREIENYDLCFRWSWFRVWECSSLHSTSPMTPMWIVRACLRVHRCRLDRQPFFNRSRPERFRRDNNNNTRKRAQGVRQQCTV